MTLTVGATHVVIGTGQFAIAQPVGLSIALAGIPGFVARDPGTPIVYHRVGRIAVGHVLGWQQPIDLGLVPQLVYPLAPEFTQLGYTLLAGVTATIGELVAPTVSPSSLMPWDRGATTWQHSDTIAAGAGTGLTTAWTYTVPAGKILRLDSWDLSIVRLSVATTVVAALIYAYVNGLIVLQTDMRVNGVGAIVRDQLAGGPLYLPAGSTVSLAYANLDTGGGVNVNALAVGSVFNA